MSRVVTLDMNRVEGDLQLKVQVEGGVVTDAWAVGTSYRGFEQLMIGRAPMDALVITPRVCGICSTAHLYAAVTALERAMGCPVAPNGTRVRNVCLMAEELQSDARQHFFMFMPDLLGAAYARRADRPALVEAFAPMTGRLYREALEHSRLLPQLIALFAGQWPHSSQMVPGGVVSVPGPAELFRARAMVRRYRGWYERSVLGCSLARWADNRSLADLLAWLDEAPSHRDSAVGRYLTVAREEGFGALGKGTGTFLSHGAYLDPLRWAPPFDGQPTLREGGFRRAGAAQVEPFDHRRVVEHLHSSWFLDRAGPDGAHPLAGETIPALGPQPHRYTWAKAPRYDGEVVEVGALAQLYVAGDALARGLVDAEGATVFARQLMRLHRPTSTLALLERTLAELEASVDEPSYLPPSGPLDSGTGVGLVEAARGSLGHWIQVEKGVITRYQIISPTTWNASPRDSGGRRGHWEQSLIGAPLPDEADPVQLGHIIRSHDPCLVCTVHVLGTGTTVRVGPR